VVYYRLYLYTVVYYRIPDLNLIPWRVVIGSVLRQPLHADTTLLKGLVIHPLRAGFNRSIGEPQGQIADYRMGLKDGKSIHVREYDASYRIHWDARDPDTDPLGHLLVDAPHWLIIGGLLLGMGALVYYSLKDN